MFRIALIASIVLAVLKVAGIINLTWLMVTLPIIVALGYAILAGLFVGTVVFLIGMLSALARR